MRMNHSLGGASVGMKVNLALGQSNKVITNPRLTVMLQVARDFTWQRVRQHQPSTDGVKGMRALDPF